MNYVTDILAENKRLIDEIDRLSRIETAAKKAFRALAQSKNYAPESSYAWTVLGTALGVVHSDDLTID